MKVVGCIIAILGVLVCVASVTLFGMAISRAMDARAVQTFPLEVGNTVESDLIKVDPSKFCMIALKAKVTSGHAKRGTGNNESYDLQYSFPFKYTVVDSAGKTVLTEDTKFADDTGSRSYSHQNVNRDGGTVEVEAGYEKFEAPAEIRIEAEIHVDEEYEAETEELQLIVYDNVSKHAKSVTSGVLLLVLGGGMSFAGLVLFIIGLVRQPSTTPQNPATTQN